jgi:hypothetical protein
VRILDHVGVQPVYLRPEYGIVEILPGQIPQGITPFDGVSLGGDILRDHRSRREQRQEHEPEAPPDGGVNLATLDHGRNGTNQYMT